MKYLLIATFLSILFISGISYADNADGLVAYYPFDGNANDESGNGNDGTVVGPSLTKDRQGRENSAYDFDQNEFIRIPSSWDIDCSETKEISFGC